MQGNCGKKSVIGQKKAEQVGESKSVDGRSNIQVIVNNTSISNNQGGNRVNNGPSSLI